MSPIDALILQSQEQHRRYYELFGTNPVRGDGLRELAAYSREVANQARDIRQQVIALHFSTAVTG
ncbi:hypothetical protein [Mycobacterium xenopi]|uniref:hypothetical protein n=1 Tax=Mycobacterium xenopi TaxID=1789 RepID=UPI000A162C7A|nr:hypothetical protein [Mycobacterium xenopi]ORX14139.1 hypothetical protein AWC32_14245 [Mycobacterium xenopi]SPX94857.1 Uncharacterised protein [Mycobacterium xenopi]